MFLALFCQAVQVSLRAFAATAIWSGFAHEDTSDFNRDIGIATMWGKHVFQVSKTPLIIKTLLARPAVLVDEDRADFRELFESICADERPQTLQEWVLIADILIEVWEIFRLRGQEALTLEGQCFRPPDRQDSAPRRAGCRRLPSGRRVPGLAPMPPTIPASRRVRD